MTLVPATIRNGLGLSGALITVRCLPGKARRSLQQWLSRSS